MTVLINREQVIGACAYSDNACEVVCCYFILALTGCYRLKGVRLTGKNSLRSVSERRCACGAVAKLTHIVVAPGVYVAVYVESRNEVVTGCYLNNVCKLAETVCICYLNRVIPLCNSCE